MRRTPVLTWGTMALCFVVFLLTVGLSDPVGDAHRQRLEQAFSFWEQHPYLQPPARLAEAFGDPGERARAEFYEAWDRNGFPPVPVELLQSEQAALEGLVGEAESILRTHVFFRLGLVPAHPTLPTAFSYAFLHAGWLHLAGNLLFLFLCGPLIENRFGRSGFLGIYLASGLAAGALFVVRSAGSTEPLVGASGAVAGLMGAFLVAFAHTRIRFGYWLGFFWGSFLAPAGLMLPLWFVGELLSARLGEVVGVTSDVAYWAHVGGFAFGVAAAFGLRALGLERRPAPGDVPGGAHAAAEEEALPSLDDVLSVSAELRERRPRDAVELLRREVLDGGDELGPALAFAEAAAAVPPVPDACDVVAVPLAAAVSHGQRLAATRIWRLLCRAVVVPEVEPETALALGGWLLADDPGAARLALFAALRSGDAGVAARVARLARGSDPVLASRAARRALAARELPASDRAPMEALAAEAERAVEAQGIVMLPEVATRPPAAGEGTPLRRDAPPGVRPPRSSDPRDPWAARAVDLSLRGADEEAAAQPAATTPTAPERRQPAAPRDHGVGIDPWSGRALEIEPDASHGSEPAPDLRGAAPEPRPAYGELAPEALGGPADAAAASDRFGADAAAASDLFGDPRDLGDLGAPDDSDDLHHAATSLAMPADVGRAPEPDPEPKPDPSPQAGRPRRLRVLAARPTRLGRQHLWVEVEGRGRTRLPYTRIQALALVGVRGLGRPRSSGSGRSRAVVVVDLALNWGSAGDELLVMRLRSDGFDPRKLVEGDLSPLAALRRLVTMLLARSRGVPLTEAAASPDEALHLHADLADYEACVLHAQSTP